MPGKGSDLSKGVCVPSHSVRHGARREFVHADERPNVSEYSCVIVGTARVATGAEAAPLLLRQPPVLLHFRMEGEALFSPSF